MMGNRHTNDPTDSEAPFRIGPYTCSPRQGLLFVDHARTGRSGHLGHALVEYAPGNILAFYPNCSDHPGLNTHGDEWRGHCGDGWMEYVRSEDGGRTWSDPIVLDYSKRAYDKSNGERSVMCEKAVCAPDGTIVLFNLECDLAINKDWAPNWVPTWMRSADHGASWTEPRPVGMARGRIFAAVILDDCILALLQGGGAYALHVSTDRGASFSHRAILPLDATSRGYGAMTRLGDGRLIACVYNREDEHHLDYTLSSDLGLTWEQPGMAYLAKKIRNPQIAPFKGGFVLHGRTGAGGLDHGHFVVYTSSDGFDWDEGTILQRQTAGAGAYSNNLPVHGPATGAVERLLIQASHAYHQSRTNIYHWWLT